VDRLVDHPREDLQLVDLLPVGRQLVDRRYHLRRLRQLLLCKCYS
jgi:hypothetical protein